jgi:hypothetical protein
MRPPILDALPFFFRCFHGDVEKILIPMTGSEKAASVFSLFFGEFDLAEIEIRGILLGEKKESTSTAPPYRRTPCTQMPAEDGSGMERSRRFERERH